MYLIDPKTNKMVYPRNQKNIEYYEKDMDGKEIYISENGIENYAFNFPSKEEIYALNKNISYYSKFDHKQIYALNLNNDLEKFIQINGEMQYTSNKYGIQFYPLNFVGSNTIARSAIGYFYARGPAKELWYPIDEFGNEFAVQTVGGLFLIIVSNSGYPIAPKKRDGSVNYLMLNNVEIPYVYNNSFFIGSNSSGDQIYPLDSLKEPYYPSNGTLQPKIAKDRHGNSKYVILSKYNAIKYPLVGSEETYIQDENSDSYTILQKHIKHFRRYILNNAKERYPIRTLPDGRSLEMIMKDLYAKQNNVKFYPKDSLSNEYINSAGVLLDSYPITSDGNIIIPNHENEPVIKANNPDLSSKIKCLLYRPDFKRYDFLINCSSKLYPIVHSESFTYTTHFKYIITLLCSIAFILFFILVVT